MTGWLVRDHETGVHILPNGDWVGHEPEDCVCGPDVEPVVRDDGSMGWLITHSSLDGRENEETRDTPKQA
jgi:hypothetical protein